MATTAKNTQAFCGTNTASGRRETNNRLNIDARRRTTVHETEKQEERSRPVGMRITIFTCTSRCDESSSRPVQRSSNSKEPCCGSTQLFMILDDYRVLTLLLQH